MNPAEFESRLESLERRMNRYRTLCIALGLGLAGLAGLAAANAPTATVTNEIRARKVVIIDEHGKEAARLFAGPHGGVLDILNYEGRQIVRGGASEKGGKFVLADGQGQPYIELTTEETGGELMIMDKAGKKNLMNATSSHAAAK